MIFPLKTQERIFFEADYKVDDLESLKIYLDKLLAFEINSESHFYTFLKNVSEAEALLGEAACWAQINITCDTENEDYKKQYAYFYTTIQPYLQVFADSINKKIIASHFAEKLPEPFFVYLRNIKKNLSLFNADNVPINAELALLQQEYGNITSKMSVCINEQDMTLQQAASLLKEHDREKRKEVYVKIAERRWQDKDALNKLFSTLLEKRQHIATNCGFETYTLYKFKELGRFDYGVQDCYNFHQGIKTHILPIANLLFEQKKQSLNLEHLYPWDLDAPEANTDPLRPFYKTDELIRKTIKCLTMVDKDFAACIHEMQRTKRLDLASRKSKAPGGYNCPLPETGVPFIFMNAVGTLDDVITMVHESGHAVHSFLSHNLELTGFKDYPMEIAELASMSMELFTMEYWDVFFENKEDLKRAKLQQWERVITIFPWIAIIDKFQHWLYAHSGHSIAEREAAWIGICKEFKTTTIDDSQTQKFAAYTWQKQLHLYEVPFYYIEYGIAQLGAIAMYKQFKKNKSECLQRYKNTLQLGGQFALPKLYEEAGISLRFDEEYLQELCLFVQAEIKLLHI